MGNLFCRNNNRDDIQNSLALSILKNREYVPDYTSDAQTLEWNTDEDGRFQNLTIGELNQLFAPKFSSNQNVNIHDILAAYEQNCKCHTSSADSDRILNIFGGHLNHQSGGSNEHAPTFNEKKYNTHNFNENKNNEVFKNHINNSNANSHDNMTHSELSELRQFIKSQQEAITDTENTNTVSTIEHLLKSTDNSETFAKQQGGHAQVPFCSSESFDASCVF